MRRTSIGTTKSPPFVVEFISNLVYYTAVATDPAPCPSTIHFSVDAKLHYNNFYLDFGPLNLGCTFQFCAVLDKMVRSAQQTHRKIVFYSSLDASFRANAACLLSCWGVLSWGMRPEDAVGKFVPMKFPAFHDASPGECDYKLTIVDCVRGLQKAVQLGYVSPSTFDVREYHHYEQVEHGDLSWISPKFLAFAGPHDTFSTSPDGYVTLTPEHYIPYFKQRNVTLVIRLNEKQYDEQRFVRAGIQHLDLLYPDGANPPEFVLQQFLLACESTPGAVAVHCKAGLGRTGTCIGAYLMKHGLFTSKEVIGWLRICRPGSIIGPQQQYMDAIEPKMWRAAKDKQDGYRVAAVATSAATTSSEQRLAKQVATSLFSINIFARTSRADAYKVDASASVYPTKSCASPPSRMQHRGHWDRDAEVERSSKPLEQQQQHAGVARLTSSYHLHTSQGDGLRQQKHSYQHRYVR